jgi:ABC-type oligopeptide transport system ATPase subunit
MIDPHEFSGGQRQRVGIARAVAGSLIVCDKVLCIGHFSLKAGIKHVK